ncbi:MAG TPA: HEAT repeat domain-containing protein [Kofleriaceae bacterium]|nr:HEAT repeat domain-containing protein [Kofleriaceae bacterium]
MSDAFTILGRIEMPAAAHAKWLAGPIDGSAWDDWAETGLLDGGSGRHASVGAYLDAVRAQLAAAGGVDIIDVAHDGERLWIRAWLSEQAFIDRVHDDLMVAARCAGAAGGKGDVFMMVPGLPMTVRLRVARKKSGFEGVEPNQGVFADEQLAKGFLLLKGWSDEKGARPALRWDEFRAGEARYWVGELAASPAQQQALQRVAAADDRALAAALADERTALPYGSPLKGRVKDVAALRAALAAAEPVARVTAIQLLARIDGDAAEPLALQLLADPSKYVRESAARALAGRGGAAAIAGLIACLGRGSPEALAAIDALATAPGDGAWLAPLLERSPFTAADHAIPAEPTPARIRELQRAHEQAMYILQVVARRADRALVPRLWALFRDPPGEGLRPGLGQVLLAIGGPEVEGREQDIQFAIHGMGLALNQDHARRAQLLRLDPDDDSGGIVKFDDVDLATMRTLIEERFTTLEMRQNEAPSTGELLQFMELWPEVTAHGYAVVPGRPDYRVTFEGLRCELDRVAADRREPLREAFAALCESANEVDTDGDVLSAWWT